MKVAVWDTYVERADGKVMHFDILAPSTVTNTHAIYHYGDEYLSTKPFETNNLTSKECRLCHMEMAPQTVENEILKKGYYIIEMENCS